MYLFIYGSNSTPVWVMVETIMQCLTLMEGKRTSGIPTDVRPLNPRQNIMTMNYDAKIMLYSHSHKFALSIIFNIKRNPAKFVYSLLLP